MYYTKYHTEQDSDGEWTSIPSVSILDSDIMTSEFAVHWDYPVSRALLDASDWYVVTTHELKKTKSKQSRYVRVKLNKEKKNEE